MEITLTKKPKSPTLIIGFPGVGLVGPIVTEFLIEHLQTEKIGEFTYDELPPTVAIHKGKLVHPMSLHYSEKHNVLILYTILNVRGSEWKVAGKIRELAKEVGAKELLCIDGATSVGEEQSKIYTFGNEKFKELGALPLNESVITGVTGALMLDPGTNCIFASTQVDMPNSKAAAEVVKFLDKYLGMEVDPAPLLHQAEQFEQKLKSLMSQSKVHADAQREMDYLG